MKAPGEILQDGGMAKHPDQDFVGYILGGIECGFRVGFDPGLVSLRCRSHKLLSAMEHERVVADYLGKEMKAGRVVKVGPGVRLSGIHHSPFGVIPKKSKPEAYH